MFSLAVYSLYFDATSNYIKINAYLCTAVYSLYFDATSNGILSDTQEQPLYIACILMPQATDITQVVLYEENKATSRVKKSSR